MVRHGNGRHPWLLAFAALAVLSVAVPVTAQTHRLGGVVTDAAGKPVDGASVTIKQVDGSAKYEAKTDKSGQYNQIGLIGNTNYSVTVTKDQLTATRVARVTGGATAQSRADFVLMAGRPDGTLPNSVNASAELQKLYNEGLDLSRAGKNDEAIAKFTSVAELNPKCSDCFYNIGYAQAQKKDYAKAEEAYRKAIEIKPDYADAFTGLASIYTAQRKFTEAADASAKAAEFGAAAGAAPGALGGGNADALFNQGVTLWNGGKIAEAKKQFEAAIAANPNHAEAHYQLAMALINEGNLKGAGAEFDTYLKLAPNGPNAAQAKAISAQLPK
jgi:tetratricopeptide (TPR) repeat protein